MAKDKKSPRPRAQTPKGFRDYFGTEVSERAEMLRQHRAEVAARVAELQECLSVLDTKIATYEAMMSDAKGPDHATSDTRDQSGARPQAAE